MQKTGGIHLTIKSWLEKIVQFLVNLRRPKITKTPKITRPSKISQRVSPDVQTKQVEQITDTTTEFPTSVITVGSSEIPYLQPGIVIDACIFCMMEDFLK